MVSTDRALEGDIVNAELVKNSLSKRCVVLNEGKYEMTDYGSERLVLDVEIDGKIKKYRPTKDTVKNLREVYGKDTKSWLGQVILLQVVHVNNKQYVLGMASLPKGVSGGI